MDGRVYVVADYLKEACRHIFFARAHFNYLKGGEGDLWLHAEKTSKNLLTVAACVSEALSLLNKVIEKEQSNDK